MFCNLNCKRSNTAGTASNEDIFTRSSDQGVVIEHGDLDGVTALALQHKTAVYLEVMERAPDRGSHSLYCTLVYIDAAGDIQSVHRKLHPTYEERLA